MTERNISLADQAYEKIKDNILNLTYEPGMVLTEAFLTRELDMSRSPIRTALKMLEAEGLIVTDFYKSMKVKEITEKDISELYQLRELLETAAFQMIFRSGRAEEFSYRIEEKAVRMKACASDPYEWEVADTNMHREIIKVFDNERINRIYENNLSELIRMGLGSVKSGMDIADTNENLKKMIRYMRQGDFEKSFAILKQDHFTIGKDSAITAIR